MTESIPLLEVFEPLSESELLCTATAYASPTSAITPGDYTRPTSSLLCLEKHILDLASRNKSVLSKIN